MIHLSTCIQDFIPIDDCTYCHMFTEGRNPMSDITEPTFEKLKRMWMSQPFAGPTEKFDAEVNFYTFMKPQLDQELHSLTCPIWTHNGGGSCDCKGEPETYPVPADECRDFRPNLPLNDEDPVLRCERCGVAFWGHRIPADRLDVIKSAKNMSVDKEFFSDDAHMTREESDPNACDA